MEIQNKAGGLLPRWLFVALMCLLEILIIVVIISTVTQEEYQVKTIDIVGFLGMQFAALIIASIGIYETETIRFTKTGIVCQLPFRTRQYDWKAIRQAGIIPVKKKSDAFYYVIVPPKGPLHNAGDFLDSFYWRSLGKNILFPVSEEAGAWIAECYGPLDFDDSKNLAI